MPGELLEPTALRRLVTAALGTPADIRHVERLPGGSKKGVYRLRLAQGSVVLYVWHETENWWPPTADDKGLQSFARAHDLLSTVDVPVPQVLLLDDTGRYVAADVAVVGDLPGPNLEQILSDDPVGAAPMLLKLREALERMRATSHPTHGDVGAATYDDFPSTVLHRALRHVDSAAGREPRIVAVADRLREALGLRAASVRRSERYSLVHGELGPDHVRIDPLAGPVLIDIEGLMWADVEWEHAFLELRFGRHYEVLRLSDLDEARMDLYRLALRVSLVEGPLRLADSDFPQADVMQAIAEHNLAGIMKIIA
jgi:Phosphotransferase enzyme family